MVSVDSVTSGTQTNEGSSVTENYNELSKVAAEEFRY